MDLKELQKDQKMMEIMKEIGSIMQMRSKQEQAEKVKNFRILNENAVKGQILFTGSSLMALTRSSITAVSAAIPQMISSLKLTPYFLTSPHQNFLSTSGQTTCVLAKTVRTGLFIFLAIMNTSCSR